MPMITRANSKPEKPVAIAKAMHPATATARKPRITDRGPYRSSQVPSGNWVSEKPRK